MLSSTRYLLLVKKPDIVDQLGYFRPWLLISISPHSLSNTPFAHFAVCLHLQTTHIRTNGESLLYIIITISIMRHLLTSLDCLYQEMKLQGHRRHFWSQQLYTASINKKRNKTMIEELVNYSPIRYVRNCSHWRYVCHWVSGYNSLVKVLVKTTLIHNREEKKTSENNKHIRTLRPY